MSRHMILGAISNMHDMQNTYHKDHRGFGRRNMRPTA